VRKLDGTTLAIPATRTTLGTSPAGSMWSKNPIPEAASFFPAPFPGAVGSRWAFSLLDEVVVPADLPAGDYILSWRWDCELTPQVWSNCGDVQITVSGASRGEAPPLTGPPLMGPDPVLEEGGAEELKEEILGLAPSPEAWPVSD
jgi:hypothetical protein